MRYRSKKPEDQGASSQKQEFNEVNNFGEIENKKEKIWAEKKSQIRVKKVRESGKQKVWEPKK